MDYQQKQCQFLPCIGCSKQSIFHNDSPFFNKVMSSYGNVWVVLRIQKICNTTRHKSPIYGLFMLYKRSQRDNIKKIDFKKTPKIRGFLMPKFKKYIILFNIYIVVRVMFYNISCPDIKCVFASWAGIASTPSSSKACNVRPLLISPENHWLL